MSATKILIVVTSHGTLGDTGKRTGLWLEELAAPYLEFVVSGAAVDIASPAGGRPPIDPTSEKSTEASVATFLADETATAKLASTRKLADVDGSAYDAIFVAGGHGVMWDLATSKTLGAMLVAAFEADKVVAAVCHGPAALVNVTLSDGRPLVAGRRVAGFSNAEEKAAELTDIMPFLLESALTERGGHYESGPLWKSFAVRDGRLVTGQNPSSSVAVAMKTLAAIAGDD